MADAQGSAVVEEVWMNYLSNALKYGGRPPRLTLGAQAFAGRQCALLGARQTAPASARQTRPALCPVHPSLTAPRTGHGLGCPSFGACGKNWAGRSALKAPARRGSSTFSFTPAHLTRPAPQPNAPARPNYREQLPIFTGNTFSSVPAKVVICLSPFVPPVTGVPGIYDLPAFGKGDLGKMR